MSEIGALYTSKRLLPCPKIEVGDILFPSNNAAIQGYKVSNFVRQTVDGKEKLLCEIEERKSKFHIDDMDFISEYSSLFIMIYLDKYYDLNPGFLDQGTVYSTFEPMLVTHVYENEPNGFIINKMPKKQKAWTHGMIVLHPKVGLILMAERFYDLELFESYFENISRNGKIVL